MELYLLVVDISHEALVTKVNDRIKEGWHPAGGIAISPDYSQGKPAGSMLFAQAMIRREGFKN